MNFISLMAAVLLAKCNIVIGMNLPLISIVRDIVKQPIEDRYNEKKKTIRVLD